jgi:hypothetical protein
MSHSRLHIAASTFENLYTPTGVGGNPCPFLTQKKETVTDTSPQSAKYQSIASECSANEGKHVEDYLAQ